MSGLAALLKFVFSVLYDLVNDWILNEFSYTGIKLFLQNHLAIVRRYRLTHRMQILDEFSVYS